MKRARLPLRVKLRRTQCEHMFSGLPVIADIGVWLMRWRQKRQIGPWASRPHAPFGSKAQTENGLLAHPVALPTSLKRRKTRLSLQDCGFQARRSGTALHCCARREAERACAMSTPKTASLGSVTGRDEFIIGEALATALIALEQLPDARQPTHNMADMKMLLNSLYAHEEVTLHLTIARWRFIPCARPFGA
jgi:hypothetical protein